MSAVNRQESQNGVVGREDRQLDWTHAAALILLSAFVLATPFVTHRFGFAGFVTTYCAATLCWLRIWSAGVLTGAPVILLAAALRVPFLFTQPQLSNDVYRYLWDGRVLASGINPYEFAPSDAHLASLRQSWHSRINHPEIRTIYPPHAMLLFAAVHQLMAWRALLIAIDIAVVLLLPPGAALAYAVCPVVIFEGVWSGHVDLVAGFLLLLAIRRRSAVAAAIAAGMKLTPIAALPALLSSVRSRARFLIVFAAVLILPALFFAWKGQLMPGLRDYAFRWIFNSPAYDVVFFAVDRLPLKLVWASAKDLLHLEAISPAVYSLLYPDFVTRVLLALTACVAIAWRRRSPTESVAALLLCSPAIHPWYWLAIAPVAIAERHVLTWLIVAAPFSYLIYAGAPKAVVYLLCYALPIAVIALRHSEPRRRRGMTIARPRPSAFSTSGAELPLEAMHPHTGRDTSPS